jgi:hypothetical protein
MQASNNNRASTILELFEEITKIYGYPSCMRGDHRTENLLVAGRQEEFRGIGRGSYIWGRFVFGFENIQLHANTSHRSVHNIRIECLWVDITVGFGKKWDNFFTLLELHDGLNVNLDAHVWLLHHLFLLSINKDINQWVATWNNHVLSRHSKAHRTPYNMYLVGMIENGLCGVFLSNTATDDFDAATEDDYAAYGIDWDDLNHRRT